MELITARSVTIAAFYYTREETPSQRDSRVLLAFESRVSACKKKHKKKRRIFKAAATTRFSYRPENIKTTV